MRRPPSDINVTFARDEDNKPAPDQPRFCTWAYTGRLSQRKKRTEIAMAIMKVSIAATNPAGAPRRARRPKTNLAIGAPLGESNTSPKGRRSSIRCRPSGRRNSETHFCQTGAEGIVAPAPVNRTTAYQLMAAFSQAWHLVMAQHRLQTHDLFHRPEIHPARHFNLADRAATVRRSSPCGSCRLR